MANFGTILLLTVTRTRVGLIGHDDLMNKRLVEVAAKEGIRGLQLCRLLTLLSLITLRSISPLKP